MTDAPLKDGQIMTDALVAQVLLARGSAAEIARRLGVTRPTVYATKRLRSLKAQRVARDLRAAGETVVAWPMRAARRTSLSEADVRAIRRARGTSTEIAARFGCSPSWVRTLRAGKGRK